MVESNREIDACIAKRKEADDFTFHDIDDSVRECERGFDSFCAVFSRGERGGESGADGSS